ncbi:hypothetical protein GCM10010431_73090 [Streptomyces kunmingensis]
MGDADSSADNTLAESFNATCKREILQVRWAWDIECEAHPDLFRASCSTTTPSDAAPPRPPQPDHLRASTPYNANYAGQSRVTRAQVSGPKPLRTRVRTSSCKKLSASWA